MGVASVGSFSVSEEDGSVGFGVGVGVGVLPVTGSFVVSAGSVEDSDPFPEVSEDLEDPDEEDVSLFFVEPSVPSPGVSEEPADEPEEAGSEGSFSVSERSAEPSLVPSEEESEVWEEFETAEALEELSGVEGSLEELHPRRIRNSTMPRMTAAAAAAMMMLRLFLLIFM